MLFFKSEFFSDYEFAIRKRFNPKKFLTLEKFSTPEQIPILKYF